MTSPDRVVNYPPSINTNFKRLSAIYSLLEQAREEHNRVGSIAVQDWARHQGRWQTYAELFTQKQFPLLIEQRRLKEAVRKESHTDVQWQRFDEDQKDVLADVLFGDKDTLRKLDTVATSQVLDELKAIDLDNLSGNLSDPLEDWTTYTEVDPNGWITVAANTLTFVGLRRNNDDTTVYDDKGVGHFGLTGVDHDISMVATLLGGESELYFWALANVVDPTNTTDPIISVRAQRSGASIRYRIETDDGAIDDSDISIVLSLIRRWMTITRDGSGSICRLYDDSLRTVLADTITSAQGTSLFQYIHNGFSRSGVGPNDTDGQIFDSDLNEASPPVPVADELPEYGQVRTAIGDPPVFGATIHRS